MAFFCLGVYLCPAHIETHWDDSVWGLCSTCDIVVCPRNLDITVWTAQSHLPGGDHVQDGEAFDFNETRLQPLGEYQVSRSHAEK